MLSGRGLGPAASAPSCERKSTRWMPGVSGRISDALVAGPRAITTVPTSEPSSDTAIRRGRSKARALTVSA
jgi:hypothetical protein